MKAIRGHEPDPQTQWVMACRWAAGDKKGQRVMEKGRLSLRQAIRRRISLRHLLVPLLLCCLPVLASAQEIRYIYDDLNRLVGVVDQQGNAAEYVYDAVGNILQIRRLNVDPAAPLAITLVRPAQGTLGTTVELFGKGFSSTPGDNQVAFNGAQATVTVATPGGLTTMVPPGATTGPITVNRGSEFASSPGPFTVLSPLTISPTEVTLAPGRTKQFTASGPAIWKVNGVQGGTATLGTITSAGLYTAPAKIPTPNKVTVTAAAPNDAKVSADATVTIAPRQPIRPIRVAVGASPFTVVVADLNRDGKLDMVTANQDSNNVSVVLGNGDGTFQSQRQVTAGSFPSSVAVGDPNRDGLPDLVTANSRSHDISILLGNGDGTFQAQRRLAVGGAFPVGVAVADLNGDRTPDVVSANLDSDDISLLQGAGDGTFQTPQRYAVGDRPFAVVVADLNGDGKPDLVTTNGNSNDIAVLLGTGDGMFLAQRRFAVGSSPTAVAVADLNRDGKLDIVTPNFESGEISILFGNGDGTFQAERRVAAGERPRAVAVADLNTDGNLDVTVANASANEVVVFLGNGNGTFQPARRFPVGERPAVPFSAFPVSVAVADLNGDGDLDIATANNFANEVWILFGNGDGTFPTN